MYRCSLVCGRDREKEVDRQTDRQAGRQTDRQPDVPLLPGARLRVGVMQLRGAVWLRHNVVEVVAVPYPLVPARRAVLVRGRLLRLRRYIGGLLRRAVRAAELALQPRLLAHTIR